MVLLFADPTLRQETARVKSSSAPVALGRAAPGGPYRDVGVAEVGPAEQVDQSVEAGQLAACQLFPLHHGGVLHSVHVVDGGDHPQT